MANINASPPAGCLVRLLWLIVGNVALALIAFAIFHHQGGFALSFRDLIFWLLVPTLLMLRYLDIRYLEGKTADNRPATIADWRRYAVGLLAASLVLWLAVHWLS